MIRLTEDGDIPSTNPYMFESGETNYVRCSETGLPLEGSPERAKCQEIFAIGLRNPFRFSIDPNTEDNVRLYFNDVGQATWEEISSDDVGANYGWPVREGPCTNTETKDCAPTHSYTPFSSSVAEPTRVMISPTANAEPAAGLVTTGTGLFPTLIMTLTMVLPPWPSLTIKAVL